MPNVAVLIDAENIDPLFASQIFDRAAAAGTIIAKEIYGAGIALNEWAMPILQFAIHMNITLKPNRFKNSSDIALVIGAMELLSAKLLAERIPGEIPAPVVDTVVIASSDSDFSLLSVRLRSAGIKVIGIGDAKKTNPAWPAACSQFVPLASPDEETDQIQAPSVSEQAEHPGQAEQNTEPAPTEKPKQDDAANAEPAEKSQPPSHAPTHAERVGHIRSFIASEIADNNGRIQASTLFHKLNKLPDYQFDQQHSKRNPLEYLARQYGDIMTVEKGKRGAIWICAAAPQPADIPAPDSVSGRDDPEERPAAAPESPAAPSEPEEDSVYAAAGIPREIALRIEKICGESSTMLVAFNKLRKEFGADDGRRYYQLAKEHRKG